MAYPYPRPDWVVSRLAAINTATGIAISTFPIYSGEFFYILALDRSGRVLRVSPYYRLRTIPGQLQFTIDSHGRVHIVLVYLKVRRAQVIHQKKVRLPYIRPAKNVVKVPTPPSTVKRAYHKARSSVLRRVKRERLRRLPSLSSKTRTRPATEQTYVYLPDFAMVGPTVTKNSIVGYINHYRSWTGVRTPGFGALKKRARPNNPFHVLMYEAVDGGYTYVWEDFIYPSSSSTYVSSYTSWAGTAATGPNPGVVSHYDNGARNRAIGKLIERAEQDVNNLAQDFVQFSQLTDMIVTTCNRLRQSVSALRRRDISGAIGSLWSPQQQARFRPGALRRIKSQSKKRFDESLASNWLELQYGWKPLLQDLNGLMRSLAYMNAGTLAVQTIRANSKAEYSESQKFDLGYGVNGGTYQRVDITHYRFGIRYRIDDPLIAFLNNTGFTNPINLGWELLPYSFVVDWFLPIGSYLESLKNWTGLHFLDGYEVRFTRQTLLYMAQYQGKKPNGTPDSGVLTRVGNYSRESVLFDRLVLSSFPSTKLPKFKNPLSWEHAANAVALMVAAFRGR